MAKYQFTATHGVEFADSDENGYRVWAKFTRNPDLDTPEGAKTYMFETDDAKTAQRVRAVDGYGITDLSKNSVKQPSKDE